MWNKIYEQLYQVGHAIVLTCLKQNIFCYMYRILAYSEVFEYLLLTILLSNWSYLSHAVTITVLWTKRWKWSWIKSQGQRLMLYYILVLNPCLKITVSILHSYRSYFTERVLEGKGGGILNNDFKVRCQFLSKSLQRLCPGY